MLTKPIAPIAHVSALPSPLRREGPAMTPTPTTKQGRTLDAIGRRHGELSIVANRAGDLHVQVIGGRRAWLITPDGRAFGAARLDEFGRPFYPVRNARATRTVSRGEDIPAYPGSTRATD